MSAPPDVENDKATLAPKPVGATSRATKIIRHLIIGALCLAAGVGIGVAANSSAVDFPLPSVAGAARTGIFGSGNLAKGPLAPDTQNGVRVGNPADSILADPSAPLNATCTYREVGGVWSPVCSDVVNNQDTTPLWEALTIEEYDVATGRLVETDLMQDPTSLAMFRRFVGSRSNASTIAMNGTLEAKLATAPTARTAPIGRGRRLVDSGTTADGTGYLIFGKDNRQRVDCANSDESPFDYVVRIRMGGGGSCSGTLIGPRHVITAAHCVWRFYNSNGNELPNSRKGYLNGTRVDVSREWGCSTFESDRDQRDGDGIRTTTTINVTNWLSWRGWTRRGDYDYDLAVLQLQDDATTNQWVGYRHIPQPVGWMTMGFTEPFKVNKEYCTAGFPGDKKTVHGQYMLYAQCRGGAVDQARSRILKTKFDVASGQSGSSMYRARHPSKSGPDNGDHGTMFDDDIAGKIQGVMSTMTTYSSGDHAAVYVRINSGRFYQICDWITRKLPAGVFNPCGSV